jgi:hypothetical protein
MGKVALQAGIRFVAPSCSLLTRNADPELRKPHRHCTALWYRGPDWRGCQLRHCPAGGGVHYVQTCVLFFDPKRVYSCTSVSEKSGFLGNGPVKPEEVRELIAETTKKIGSVPDLLLIHNRAHLASCRSSRV